MGTTPRRGLKSQRPSASEASGTASGRFAWASITAIFTPATGSPVTTSCTYTRTGSPPYPVGSSSQAATASATAHTKTSLVVGIRCSASCP